MKSDPRSIPVVMEEAPRRRLDGQARFALVVGAENFEGAMAAVRRQFGLFDGSIHPDKLDHVFTGNLKVWPVSEFTFRVEMVYRKLGPDRFNLITGEWPKAAEQIAGEHATFESLQMAAEEGSVAKFRQWTGARRAVDPEKKAFSIAKKSFEAPAHEADRVAAKEAADRIAAEYAVLERSPDWREALKAFVPRTRGERFLEAFAPTLAERQYRQREAIERTKTAAKSSYVLDPRSYFIHRCILNSLAMSLGSGMITASNSAAFQGDVWAGCLLVIGYCVFAVSFLLWILNQSRM